MQQLCCRLLGHQLTIHQYDIFKPVCDARISLCLRNILLYSPMGRTQRLLRSVKEKYLQTAQYHITPDPVLRENSDDFTPPVTMRTTTSSLMRLDSYIYLSLPLVHLKPCAAKALHPKQSLQYFFTRQLIASTCWIMSPN